MNKLINKSEYLKAKRIVEKYEKQPTKKTIPKKKVISHNERRLTKAKKIYKIGTKFTSLYGADDQVSKNVSLFGKKESSLYIGDFGNILAFCESGSSRIIYSDGMWAKIFK